MPYTSPLSRSPASSSVSSPSTSRRSSVQMSLSGAVKSDLPRSTSYLARHRRTGSVQASIGSNLECSKYMNNCNQERSCQKSLGKVPSLVLDGQQVSNGVKSSPSPELIDNNCDDETILELSDNARLDKDKDLKHQKAITKCNGQKYEALPNPVPKIAARIPDVPENRCCPDINSTVEVGETKELVQNKVCSNRYRSNTIRELPILLDNDSSSDDETDFTPKLTMVRKKSGELVRPALRPPVARRRPSSMPGTPTYSKAVHFDSHLEHIRHFLQVDRPLAVSAGSSPVPNYDSDTEFPFGGEYSREPPYEWELIVSKFPEETPERLAQAVRVERVFLSNDNKILVGSVIVANLAYNKSVVVRFTLDYWKTTSEVVADFNEDSRQPIREGFDRFNFNIKLSDLANLDAKTMFFCVKYTVNGLDFWDNNNYANFQLDFRKKAKFNTATTSTTARLNNTSLPRSNHRSAQSRPKSMSIYFDDYADGFDGSSQFINFQNTIDDCMGESKVLRTKASRSKQDLVLDAQIQNIGQPNGNAFGNRYDFGASLNAAIKASNVSRRDIELVKLKAPDGKTTHYDEPISPSSNEPLDIANPDFLVKESTQPVEVRKPGLSSQSYNDLLDKYCFFGSAKTSPQLKDDIVKSNKISSYDRFGYLYSLNESTNSNSLTITDEHNHFSPNQRINQSSPITSRLIPSMFPAYQNLHEGYPFLETHAATAIRGQ